MKTFAFYTQTALFTLLIGSITICQGRFANPCERPCTLEFDPKCGTDGKTYPNRCAMEVSICTDQILGDPAAERLAKAYDGPCGGYIPNCSLYDSLPGCTREWNPVCGTDGQTYGTLCVLCQHRRTNLVNISHKGSC